MTIKKLSCQCEENSPPVYEENLPPPYEENSLSCYDNAIIFNESNQLPDNHCVILYDESGTLPNNNIVIVYNESNGDMWKNISFGFLMISALIGTFVFALYFMV